MFSWNGITHSDHVRLLRVKFCIKLSGSSQQIIPAYFSNRCQRAKLIVMEPPERSEHLPKETLECCKRDARKVAEISKGANRRSKCCPPRFYPEYSSLSRTSSLMFRPQYEMNELINGGTRLYMRQLALMTVGYKDVIPKLEKSSSSPSNSHL